MATHLYLPVAGVAANAMALLGVGAAVGFLSGMFGVGGGFLLTPLLMFLGIPAGVAIATGANQAVATGAAGALAQHRLGNVDVRIGMVLVSSGIAGSLLGVMLVTYLRSIGQFEAVLALSYVILLGTVGSLMLIESVRAIVTAGSAPASPVRRGITHTWVHGLPWKMRFPHSKLYASVLPVIGIGFFVGVLNALMGVGGGFILVPAMVYILKMRTRIAIGTSLFQIVFVSAVTTLLQATSLHNVDILLGLLLIVSGVVGAQWGARAGSLLAGEQLRALMALLVLAVCLRVAAGLILTPDDLYALQPLAN